MNPLDDLKLGRGATAIIGLVVVFFIAVLINLVAGLFSGFRADLTENNIYTLSEGTKSILSKLETPVTLRYYANENDMSPGEKARAQRIREKLDEFVSAAPAREVEIADPETDKFVKKKIQMLKVEKLNPEPNTDAEDSAEVDMIQPVISRETNNKIYMGIAVKCVDAEETLPWIDTNDEETLEYDLARAISSVHGGKEKTVRVMTSLPVSGGMGANFQAPPQQQWVFFQQTSQDYNIETLSPSAKEIPDDTACLVVLHPYDVTDEGQFAIDQFLLKGGNVMVMVDPNFFYARSLAGGQPQMPGMPPQQGPPPSSDLEKLFKAWGVKYDTTEVVADLSFASQIIRPGNFSPTFLTLNDQAIDGDEDDSIASMLNHLNMLTPGAFDISPPEGVTVDKLVQTSPNNKFVSSFDADPTADGGTERIRKDFEPSNVRRPLIARLSGTFTTAFPEGDPSAKEEEEEEKSDDAETGGEDDDKEKKDEAEKDEKKDDSLKKSVKPGQVLLISDVDFIFDPICVQRNRIPGTPFESIDVLNQNLTLFQNAIEVLSNDPDLVNVRSRTGRRPFTKQNEWLREAEEKFRPEIESYEEQEKAAEQRLNDLLAKNPENIREAIFSPEVQAEIKKLREDRVAFSKRARELEKEVAREFRNKLAFFKFSNTLIMPFIIIIAGIGIAVYRRTQRAAR